jgi:hypothetical protein
MGKIDRTGRSNKKPRYVMLPHYVMDTFAWQRLSVTARSAWLEFVRVHNGFNNGQIAMSERELGERLRVSHDTARRAINELLTFAFIVMTKGIDVRQQASRRRIPVDPCPRRSDRPKGTAIQSLPEYRKGRA